MSIDKKLEPGIHSEVIAEVPVDKISHEDLEYVLEIPGSDANVVNKPEGPVVVEITRNSIVLPEKKKAS